VNTYVVGLCHHDMARPQVADRGMASDMEGSCEYIEYCAGDKIEKNEMGWVCGAYG